MREGLKAYAFMAPALVILILFTIIPIIGSLVLMFFDYSVLGQTKFGEHPKVCVNLQTDVR